MTYLCVDNCDVFILSETFIVMRLHGYTMWLHGYTYFIFSLFSQCTMVYIYDKYFHLKNILKSYIYIFSWKNIEMYIYVKISF